MSLTYILVSTSHDDVIKWKHFPRYWPFVRGIHRSPVNSPHKSQWRRALMFSLIYVWMNGWVNNREAGDLRCYHAHYDVTVTNGYFDISFPSLIHEKLKHIDSNCILSLSHIKIKSLQACLAALRHWLGIIDFKFSIIGMYMKHGFATGTVICKIDIILLNLDRWEQGVPWRFYWK